MGKDEISVLDVMNRFKNLNLVIDTKDWLITRTENIHKLLSKKDSGIAQNKLLAQMGITNEKLFSYIFSVCLDEEGAEIFLDAILELDDLDLLKAIDRKDIEFFQNYFNQAFKVALVKDQLKSQGGMYDILFKVILSSNLIEGGNINTDEFEKEKANLKVMAQKMGLKISDV